MQERGPEYTPEPIDKASEVQEISELKRGQEALKKKVEEKPENRRLIDRIRAKREARQAQREAVKAAKEQAELAKDIDSVTDGQWNVMDQSDRNAPFGYSKKHYERRDGKAKK